MLSVFIAVTARLVTGELVKPHQSITIQGIEDEDKGLL
jgi:hypothetical protein